MYSSLSETTNVLGGSLARVLEGIILFLPNLVVAVILVLVGWLFGGILGRAVTHLINLLKVDQTLKKIGLEESMSGMNFNVAKILGGLVKWAIIVAFLMTAAQGVGLESFAAFLWTILGYIPNVIVAAFILIASFVLADFVFKLVSDGSRAAGVKHGAAAVLAKYSIVITGVLAALAQLNIAAGFTEILFTGFVGAVSLAIGLAFGLGGKDTAARMLSRAEKDWE